MPDTPKPPAPLFWVSEAANDPDWAPVVVPLVPEEEEKPSER